MDIRPLLDAVPLLRGLGDGARNLLAEHATVRRFAAGEVLWTAGSEPGGLLFVAAGRVRVVRAPGGRQYVLHTEGPGGTLGEVPLFSGGRYPATAIAAEPTVCLAVERATIARAIVLDPELAFLLLARLAERVRTLAGRLDRGAARPVRARLAAHLLARHREAAGAAFAVGPSQNEAAEELGTVREVLVRTLRAMCASGLIVRAGRGRFRVVDETALQRAAAGP